MSSTISTGTMGADRGAVGNLGTVDWWWDVGRGQRRDERGSAWLERAGAGGRAWGAPRRQGGGWIAGRQKQGGHVPIGLPDPDFC